MRWIQWFLEKRQAVRAANVYDRAIHVVLDRGAFEKQYASALSAV